MKKRVLVIVPLFITEEETANIKKSLKTYAWDATEINVTGLQRNIAVNSRSEAEIATPEFVDLAVKAERNGYDAVISYCYLDVGVDATRASIKIPVMGPLEASTIAANMLGRKFSVISAGATYPPGEFYVLPRLRELGLDGNYVSSRGIAFEKFFVFSKDARQVEIMRRALMEECRKALSDGAHILILACTGFPPAKNLSDELKVPIIDGAITLKLAEALTDLKRGYGKLGSYKHLTVGRCQEEDVTKTRIALLVPNSTPLEPDLSEKLRRLVNKGTEIDTVQFEDGPESINSASEIAKVAPFVIREAANAEKKGYNAVVIYSFEDLGLESAREMCEIPVIGLAESSMLLACMLGTRFSVINYDGRVQPLVETISRKVGLEKRLLSIRSIGKQAGKKLSKLDSMMLLHEIENAVKEGAEAIIIGEADAFEMVQQIRRKVKIPILDPLSVALKMAEVFHSLNLSHSKLSYPKPTLPQYHKRRLKKLERRPTQDLFLYGNEITNF